MWNQIIFKSRPILTNNLCLLKKKRLLHTQSAINSIPCYNNDINRRLINNLTSQRSHLISLLPKHFSSSTSTPSTTNASDSTVTSKTHENIEDKDNDDDNVTIDEHTLDKLYEEMDQRINEVNRYIQLDSQNRQYKIYGLALITVVAGVMAGAYAAHFGAWFLDKVGLFIFEEDDDDD